MSYKLLKKGRILKSFFVFLLIGCNQDSTLYEMKKVNNLQSDNTTNTQAAENDEKNREWYNRILNFFTSFNPLNPLASCNGQKEEEEVEKYVEVVEEPNGKTLKLSNISNKQENIFNPTTHEKEKPKNINKETIMLRAIGGKNPYMLTKSLEETSKLINITTINCNELGKFILNKTTPIKYNNTNITSSISNKINKELNKHTPYFILYNFVMLEKNMFLKGGDDYATLLETVNILKFAKTYQKINLSSLLKRRIVTGSCIDKKRIFISIKTNCINIETGEVKNDDVALIVNRLNDITGYRGCCCCDTCRSPIFCCCNKCVQPIFCCHCCTLSCSQYCIYNCHCCYVPAIEGCCFERIKNAKYIADDESEYSDNNKDSLNELQEAEVEAEEEVSED